MGLEFRLPLVLTAAAAVLALPALGSTDDQPAREEFALSLKQVKNWEFVLPGERWLPVGDAILLAGFEGGFAVERTGALKIEVDTNADGKVDKAIKGADGEVVLRGRDADGARMSYPVRFKSEGKNWLYATGGAASGKLAGVQVKIIDQDGDGLFNEVGVDAMTVGAAKGASFLSRVVNLGGDLYELEVAANGRGASISPWVGETGKLDLNSGFDCRGDLVSAVVKGGDTSFNVAGARGGLLVPTGEYRLVYGFARKGEETVEIGGGRMIPLVVNPSAEREVEWGGPISAEVGYSRAGEDITVGADLRFYGTAGEEYTRFLPEAKSPKILVYDAETGKLLDSGRFAGC